MITWANNWGPRLGASYDLTGDGRTLVKASYGQFWLYPGADFASSINPNASTWYRQYRWTTDLNRNGVWDPGEEGALLGCQRRLGVDGAGSRHCRTPTPIRPRRISNARSQRISAFAQDSSGTDAVRSERP